MEILKYCSNLTLIRRNNDDLNQRIFILNSENFIYINFCDNV